MGTYKTVQGDTWDLIAYKLYGNVFFTPPLLEANPAYIDTVIFPSGISLSIPELPSSYIEDADTPPWREL